MCAANGVIITSSIRRGSAPARHHGQPILVEELSLDAGHGEDVAGASDLGGSVAGQRHRSEGRGRLGVSDPGELGHAGQCCGRIEGSGTASAGTAAEDGDAQLGRVGAGQIGGEGGLGTAGCGRRAHGQPADQADEQDQGEIAAPPTAEGGPVPVRRHPQALAAQGHAARSGPRSVPAPSPTLSIPRAAAMRAFSPRGAIWPRGSASRSAIVLPPGRPGY